MQIKVALILFFLLSSISNLFAEESKKILYIGYLKPYEHPEIKKKFRKDPMEEPSLKSHKKRLISEPENLDLKGILFNPNEKRAFINGELYKEGDTILGYSISKILPDKVILKKHDGEFELKIE